MTDAYDWHVSACRAGMGETPRMVYHVQRYLPPCDGRRYTGEIVKRTFTNEADAQAVSDAANAGNAPRDTRGTYL